VCFIGGVVTNSDSSPAGRLARQIEFIVEVDKLKEIFRQTVTTQSRRAENDAEHSWHLCLCVLVLAEHANSPRLDVLRVLKMLILHDLVEIDAGDTFAYDTARMAGQHEREAVAADRIFGLLPADQARDFRVLWDEFEEKQTPEARFASAIDRFQPNAPQLPHRRRRLATPRDHPGPRARPQCACRGRLPGALGICRGHGATGRGCRPSGAAAASMSSFFTTEAQRAQSQASEFFATKSTKCHENDPDNMNATAADPRYFHSVCSVESLIFARISINNRTKQWNTEDAEEEGGR